MFQKLLGVCFFSTIIVLSYVATLHIVTNRVDELHHRDTNKERIKGLRLSGPVSLVPISDHAPAGKKKYPVRKLSRPEPVKKTALKNAKSKKKSERHPASVSKKKKHSKKKHH